MHTVGRDEHAAGDQDPSQLREHAILLGGRFDVVQHVERGGRGEPVVVEGQGGGVPLDHVDVGTGEPGRQSRRAPEPGRLRRW